MGLDNTSNILKFCYDGIEQALLWRERQRIRRYNFLLKFTHVKKLAVQISYFHSTKKYITFFSKSRVVCVQSVKR